MSGSTEHLDLIVAGSAGQSVQASNLHSAASPAALWGRRPSQCVGLTWGYYGGRYNGYAVSNGTLTFGASTTNYIYADATTGAVSSNTTGYPVGSLPCYTVITSTTAVTSWSDDRQMYKQGGVVTGAVNVFTKNQSVTPVALTRATTTTVDASLSNIFEVTLDGNITTLANPTNLTGGMTLILRIKQDGTGGRTVGFGTKYKWPGGTAPTITTTAGKVDIVTAVYSATDDLLYCSILQNY